MCNVRVGSFCLSLADLYSEDGALEESLAWAAAAAFTREEQERLVALPRVRPLVARPYLAAKHLALADLLYRQCFARRWHQGEASTEAAALPLLLHEACHARRPGQEL